LLAIQAGLSVNLLLYCFAAINYGVVYPIL
jgi:hypothetical protein